MRAPIDKGMHGAESYVRCRLARTTKMASFVLTMVRVTRIRWSACVTVGGAARSAMCRNALQIATVAALVVETSTHLSALSVREVGLDRVAANVASMALIGRCFLASVSVTHALRGKTVVLNAAELGYASTILAFVIQRSKGCSVKSKLALTTALATDSARLQHSSVHVMKDMQGMIAAFQIVQVTLTAMETETAY